LPVVSRRQLNDFPIRRKSSAWSDKFSGAPQPTTTAGNIVGLTPFRNYFSDAVSVPRLAQTLITEGF
jgi:hypothetical protein